MRLTDLRWRTSATTAAAVIATIVAGAPAVSSSASAKVEDVVISPSEPWWTSRIGMHSPTTSASAKNQISSSSGTSSPGRLVASVGGQHDVRPSSETG